MIGAVSWLRILFVAAALALAANGLSACGSSRGATTRAGGALSPIRLCGSLSTGQGLGRRGPWDVSEQVLLVVKATRNVPCADARSLMHRVIATSGHCKSGDGGNLCRFRFERYRCASLGQFGVLCANRTRTVAATPTSPTSIYVLVRPMVALELAA